jgi:hypothetical protein
MAILSNNVSIRVSLPYNLVSCDGKIRWLKTIVVQHRYPFQKPAAKKRKKISTLHTITRNLKI